MKLKFLLFLKAVTCTKYLFTVKDGLDESVAMKALERGIAKVGGIVLNRFDMAAIVVAEIPSNLSEEDFKGLREIATIEEEGSVHILNK